EHEAADGVRVLDALADDPEHDVVGDELTGVHGGLRLEAELGSARHRLPQQVAGGDLRYAVLLHEHLGLGALSRTGCAQQYDSHRSPALSPKSATPSRPWSGFRSRSLRA